MPNILDILARAQSLMNETALNSITPPRAGGIMYDTLLVLNQMQLEGASLLISKVYASVSAMEADTTPTSDLTGRVLKPGQLVVIVTSDTSSSDMGSEYRYNGPGSWTYVGKVGGLPLDTVPTQNSTKGITSGGVYAAQAAIEEDLTDLDHKVDELQINEIDGSPLMAEKAGKVISSSDDGLKSNSGYNVYLIANDGFTRISGKASAYSGSPMVAFYSGAPSSSTFISRINATVSRQDEAFDTLIPPGTAVIALNASTQASTPTATLYKPFDLKQVVLTTEERVSELEVKVDGTNEFVNAQSNSICTNASLGVVASTGLLSSRSSWFASDYIPVAPGSQFIWKQNSASTYGIAFYSSPNEEDYISGIVNDGNEQSTIVPLNAHYFRCCDYATTIINNYVKYYTPILGLSERVSVLEYKVSDSQKWTKDGIFNGKAILKTGEYLLGLGASFMRGNATGDGTNNSWLHTLASKIGINCYNDASGGTNICYHANRLFAGTILGTGNAPIADVSAVLIMHTHNKDVYTLPEPFASYSVADYESNVLPFSTTTGDELPSLEYAKAFDYCIKKIIALYKNKVSSVEYVSSVASYMGTYVPKPCQIVLATHWHDARTIYNESVRKLALKWGIPLVRFDDKIGFTKDQLNPSTGAQASIEYVGNVDGASPLETINGVVYGWHPMCGSADVYIQRKMASIAKESFELI